MTTSSQISINTRRLDWPDCVTVEIEPGQTTLAELRARYPTVVPPSHQLYCQGADGRWVKVAGTDLLRAGAGYQLRAEITDAQRRDTPLICTVCGAPSETLDALRYHPGRLVPQAWHYTIHTWEWVCCSRIVPYSRVEALVATDGCRIGRCAACRDLSAYHTAIARYQAELEAL